MDNKFTRFWKWIYNRPLWVEFRDHLKDFPYIWFGIGLIFAASLTDFLFKGSLGILIIHLYGLALGLIVALLLIRPMGASGDIRLFFANFILITLIFAGVYHIGFFRNAGISYDVNQPHIDFDMYVDSPRNPKKISVPSKEMFIYERNTDGKSERDTLWRITETVLEYQPITFGFTWRNTILTTLMQQPVEFFSIAATANESMDSPTLSKTINSSQNRFLKQYNKGSMQDSNKAALFYWILIIHILISWIFFGVFISLLYNKFRYES